MDIIFQVLFIAGGACILALIAGGGMTFYNGFTEKGVSHIKAKTYTGLIITLAILTMVYTAMV